MGGAVTVVARDTLAIVDFDQFSMCEAWQQLYFHFPCHYRWLLGDSAMVAGQR